jgi:very-short-patch-repair endonuclease
VRRFDTIANMQRIHPDLTSNARTLRSNMTDAERLLWRHLRQIRPRFTRQLVVDRYILDFACRTARIAIELDGGQHAEAVESDRTRDAYLKREGWSVLRFWNHDVMANVEGVISAILATVSRGSTHPQPLPFREG